MSEACKTTLTPCSDGTLRGFFIPIEDYPKVVAYANEHKMLLTIRAVNIASRWRSEISCTLSPETKLLTDKKIDLE